MKINHALHNRWVYLTLAVFALSFVCFANCGCTVAGAASGVSIKRDVCFSRTEVTKIRKTLEQRKLKLEECRIDSKASRKKQEALCDQRVKRWQGEALACSDKLIKATKKKSTLLRDIGIGLAIAGAAVFGGLLGYGVGKATK